MDTSAKTFLSESCYRDMHPSTNDANSGSGPKEQPARISTATHQVERDDSLDRTLFQRDLTPTQCKPELSSSFDLPTLMAHYPDKDGDSFLHMAVVHNILPLAQLWKNNCSEHFTADLNRQNDLGQTPLHIAVYNQNSEMIQFLLENGASALTQERKGRTPVHFACQFGCIGTLRLLLQQIEKSNQSLPAALNAEVFDGGLNSLLFFISLHNPVKEEQFPIVDLLLQYGADPNHQDKCSGKTLVHYLADQNNVALYKYLQTNYPSEIDWNAERYDSGRVTLENDIFVFEKDEV
ncbi:ankyrin repeat domain-containing protein [Endozoicomonas sp. ONNA2]|uniref:ankyrin repeat domain-containing protein n=1 Tax=Endozoicomonas sp. ONNA2 TaxID=2828741 RepID=UPI002147BEF0|nr:ankyrin repeat domain-containing protein [Endozoicomonas sp. ONNA2]